MLLCWRSERALRELFFRKRFAFEFVSKEKKKFVSFESGGKLSSGFVSERGEDEDEKLSEAVQFSDSRHLKEGNELLGGVEKFGRWISMKRWSW